MSCRTAQYTVYNNLNGDSSAHSADDCKSNCCSNTSCQVWQWSDDPFTPPNCWSGDGDDYGDSGGVEWLGEQGKAPLLPPAGFGPCGRYHLLPCMRLCGKKFKNIFGRGEGRMGDKGDEDKSNNSRKTNFEV